MAVTGGASASHVATNGGGACVSGRAGILRESTDCRLDPDFSAGSKAPGRRGPFSCQKNRQERQERDLICRQVEQEADSHGSETALVRGRDLRIAAGHKQLCK